MILRWYNGNKLDNLGLHITRGVVLGGARGCHVGRSDNPISTRGDRLCPPDYYWHHRIFRPSDGPDNPMYDDVSLAFIAIYLDIPICCVG